MSEGASAFNYDSSSVGPLSTDAWHSYLTPKETDPELRWHDEYLKECWAAADDVSKSIWTSRMNRATKKKGAASKLARLQQEFKQSCGNVVKQLAAGSSTSLTADGIFVSKIVNLAAVTSVVTRLTFISSHKLPVSVPIAAAYTLGGCHYLCISVAPLSASRIQLPPDSDLGACLSDRCLNFTLCTVDFSDLKSNLFVGSDLEIYYIPHLTGFTLPLHPKVIEHTQPSTFEISTSEKAIIHGSCADNVLEKVRSATTLEDIDSAYYWSGLTLFESAAVFGHENFAKASSEVQALLLSNLIVHAVHRVSSSVLAADSNDDLLNRANYLFHVCLSASGIEWEVVCQLVSELFCVPTSLFATMEPPSKILKTNMATRLCQLLGATLSKGQITELSTMVEATLFSLPNCVSGNWYEPSNSILQSKITACKETSKMALSSIFSSTKAAIVMSNFSADRAEQVRQESDVNLLLCDAIKHSNPNTHLDHQLLLLQAGNHLDYQDSISYLKKLLEALSLPEKFEPTTITTAYLYLRAVSYLSIAFNRVKNEDSVHNNLSVFHSGHSLYKSLVESDPPVIHTEMCAEEIVSIIQMLTRCHQFTGDNEKALDSALTVKSIITKWKGSDDEEVAVAATEVGHTLMELERLEEATAEFREAVRVYHNLYGDNHVLTATALNNLACLDYSSAKIAARKHRRSHFFLEPCLRAKDSLERIVNMPQHVLSNAGADEDIVVNATTNLAHVELLLKNFDAAEKWCTKALEEALLIFDEKHPDVISARKTLSVCRTRRRAACCVRIQSLIRGYLARRKTSSLRYTFRAATTSALIIVYNEYRFETSLKTLQTIGRGFIVRHQLGVTLSSSLYKLQKAGRGMLARLNVSPAVDHSPTVRILQRVGRSYIHRLNLLKESESKVTNAVCNIQRVARGLQTRMQFVKDLHQQREDDNAAACLMLQKVGRSFFSRVRTGRLRCSSAAAKIQAAHRGNRARALVTKRRDEESNAANIITRVSTAYLARKLLFDLRTQNNAATRIQTIQRGAKSRAATKADIAARKALWSNPRTPIPPLVHKIDKEQVGALRIQCVMRGGVSRRRLLHNKSAQIIQRHVRGFLTRLNLSTGTDPIAQKSAQEEEQRDLNEPAKVIQTSYRSYRIRSSRQNTVLDGSAIMIQATWKGYSERKAYKKNKAQLRVEKARAMMELERRLRKERVLKERSSLQQKIAANRQQSDMALVSLFVPRGGRLANLPVRPAPLGPLPPVSASPKSKTDPRHNKSPRHGDYQAVYRCSLKDIRKRAASAAMNRLMNRVNHTLPWIPPA